MAKRKTLVQMAPPQQSTKPELDVTAYNEAVRLQCAVRDTIGATVSMIEALQIAREQFASVTGEKAIIALRRRVEQAAADRETERIARQAEISANAGKR